jgi:hypothetical protein
MAVSKMRYKDLNHALRLLRGQVMEGVPYAQENLPEFQDPEKLYNYLKLRTRYKNDPKGVELFQTLPTLLDNNFHGLTGAGDCDCFTIAALSVLLANGFTNCGIVLAGRNPFTPAHIYAYVIDEKGEKKYLDLTNKVYDYERFYPYKQEIQFNLTPQEKKMMLQLADNGDSPYTGYIQLPAQGIQLREDLGDEMSNAEWQTMLMDNGYSLEEIAELSGRRRQRKDEKRARKEKKKSDKNERKNKKTESKAKAREAKAEGKRLRGEGKRLKGENGGGDDWKSALTTVTDAAGNVIGKWKGTERQDEPRGGGGEGEDNAPTTTNKRTSNDPKMVNILGMEISQTTAIIGGVVIAAGIVGIAVAVNKNKKRKRLAA